MKRLGEGKARYVSTILSEADGKALERVRRSLSRSAGARVGKSACARTLIQAALKAVAEGAVQLGMPTVKPPSYPELEREIYLSLEPETERETLIPSASEAKELAAEI